MSCFLLLSHSVGVGATPEAAAGVGVRADVNSPGQSQPHGGRQNIPVGHAAQAQEGSGAEGEDCGVRGVHQERGEGQEA